MGEVQTGTAVVEYNIVVPQTPKNSSLVVQLPWEK